MNKPKRSRCSSHISITDYGRFAICEGENIEPFIVDSDIADEIKNRSWCSSHGYPATRLNNQLICLHDYVMAHVVDEKPHGVYVDHINQDKLDNRRQNLRFVDPTDSSHNMPLSSNNTSGHTGVSERVFPNGRSVFRSYITVNRKRIQLGEYRNIEDAINARREAETRYGFKTRPGTLKELLTEKEDADRGKTSTC